MVYQGMEQRMKGETSCGPTRSNQPPVLGPIGDLSVDEQVELSFTATATDPDIPTNILTFSLDGAPKQAGGEPYAP